MIKRAGKERLAPMLMTALTAGIALVPLAMAAGEPGKEILYPVATVIIGGLISSTLLDFFSSIPRCFGALGARPAEQQLLATDTMSSTMSTTRGRRRSPDPTAWLAKRKCRWHLNVANQRGLTPSKAKVKYKTAGSCEVPVPFCERISYCETRDRKPIEERILSSAGHLQSVFQSLSSLVWAWLPAVRHEVKNQIHRDSKQRRKNRRPTTMTMPTTARTTAT